MSIEDLFAELEATGEDTVRKNLASNSYRSDKIPKIQEWLRRKEEISKNDFNQAMLGTARSTRTAAWVAGTAAWVAALAALAGAILLFWKSP